jgi:SAM-dependent methyltransferase
MNLLDDRQLEQSGIVANCRMNRERCLTGSNGYSREIGFNPLEHLRKIVQSRQRARWLDLCCGSGNALIEAARIAAEIVVDLQIEILGIDLVDQFRPTNKSGCLRLVEASLASWQPDGTFDLITCVHGLHYLGDKLGLVARAVSWLTEGGLFVANLDLQNLRFQNGRSAAREIVAHWRAQELEYDRRRRLLRCPGTKSVKLPFRYLGADDRAGPNYTGQPAVNSYYEANGGGAAGAPLTHG